MVLTLKLVSTAFDYADGAREEGALTAHQRASRMATMPSFLAYLVRVTPSLRPVQLALMRARACGVSGVHFLPRHAFGWSLVIMCGLSGLHCPHRSVGVNITASASRAAARAALLRARCCVFGSALHLCAKAARPRVPVVWLGVPLSGLQAAVHVGHGVDRKSVV